jgi:pimeloyl-ACP methyl ester carboxylesterase
MIPVKTTRLQLANGLSTRVVDTGSGKSTLVLVHGLANAIEIWDRVLPRLMQRYRVVAFDLPGFGQADRPRAAYDAAFFASQLRAFLDAMNIDRAYLVGSSLGASAIIRFSETGLDRIDRAVLAAPGGFGRQTHPIMRIPALPLIGYWLGRPNPSNNALTIRLAMHDRRHATPELIALTNRYAAVPGSHRSFVRTLQTGVGLFGVKERDSFAGLAGQFDRPALVVWGKEDRVFPTVQSKRAMELLPQAELRLIDECGHYPQWEQPDAFADAVEAFLP